MSSKPTLAYNEEYVEINGISQYLLHYPDPGSRDVLLMLHGGPGVPNSVLAYHHQPFYGRLGNVVYYDQRATGKTQLKSKTTAADLSWDLLLEDLRQTVAYLKRRYDTDRIILVGHSFGSMLGNDYVTKHPGDVLALIGSGVVTDSRRQGEVFYQHIREAVAARGIKRDLKKLQKVSPAHPHVSAKEFTTGVRVLSDLEMKYGYTKVAYMPLLRKSPLMSLRDFGQIPKSGKLTQKLVAEVEHNYDITGTTKYGVPVFYILGRKDLWTSGEIAAEHLTQLEAPQKGLYWIEDAGHFVDTDEPGEFFDIIREIVAKLA
ncbi:MAG: alpha/beta hydrolase [Promicromonosporaceae bacterium]|nr:alpha/beta hydrolase [Promicromonosporaceae bacterium]